LGFPKEHLSSIFSFLRASQRKKKEDKKKAEDGHSFSEENCSKLPSNWFQYHPDLLLAERKTARRGALLPEANSRR